jgi:hypothetical protein
MEPARPRAGLRFFCEAARGRANSTRKTNENPARSHFRF